jgi:Zn-dependent protease
MALMWLIFAVILIATGVGEEFPHKVAQAGIITNLLIFAFNLFPLPPLDGGRVLTSMLPHQLAFKFAKIEPYGFFILLALLYFGVLSFWIQPVMWLAGQAVKLIASPITLLLT